MQEQHGDNPVPVFSFMGNAVQHPQQLPCWITETNQFTHDIIRGGLDRSPLFTGVIEGVGPRYCPRSRTNYPLCGQVVAPDIS